MTVLPLTLRLIFMRVLPANLLYVMINAPLLQSSHRYYTLSYHEYFKCV